MITVHKYRFDTKIKMPKGATILSAQYQSNSFPAQTKELYLWAKVDSDNEEEFRKFIVYGTGHEMRESNLEYIATIQNPPFVWHIFEIKE